MWTSYSEKNKKCPEYLFNTYDCFSGNQIEVLLKHFYPSCLIHIIRLQRNCGYVRNQNYFCLDKIAFDIMFLQIHNTLHLPYLSCIILWLWRWQCIMSNFYVLKSLKSSICFIRFEKLNFSLNWINVGKQA